MAQDDSIDLSPQLGTTTWLELLVVRAVRPVPVIRRELASPVLHHTVGNLAIAHGINPLQFTPHLLLLPEYRIEPTTWDSEIQTGTSVLVLAVGLAGQLEQLVDLLRHTPGILPRRMIWPR